MDIYTPIEEAGKLIRERWADEGLRKMVEEKLNNDIPETLKVRPHGLLWRCVCTPDGEFERFLELCKRADLEPIGFEYIEDKFYPGNFTKYSLTYLPFSLGINKDSKTIVRKEKIIDFDKIQGGSFKMSELKTLWGEKLVDFHHFFLLNIFPIMKGKIVEMSAWNNRHGVTPEKYYDSVLSFAVCHTIYFDDFDLLESEENFIDEIVLPAYKEVEKRFGVKPIIVKISRVGEHEKNPFWWSYSKEAEDIMKKHIKEYKS